MQIGLDPNNPDLALFQCFYRHGLLPVMEIVFVLQKTTIVPDIRIAFESVWGMPMSGLSSENAFPTFRPATRLPDPGTVEFTELEPGRTKVDLSFGVSLPDLLVEMKIGVFGVQNSLVPILTDNLGAFKALAEEAARDPAAGLPPRQEAGERAYVLFDEEADLAEFDALIEGLDLGEDENEDEEGVGAEQQAAGASGGAAGRAAAAAEPGETSDAGQLAAGAAAAAAGTAAAAGGSAAASARRKAAGQAAPPPPPPPPAAAAPPPTRGGSKSAAKVAGSGAAAKGAGAPAAAPAAAKKRTVRRQGS
ncbi:hypothetical protein GPECTOR_58g540 [Gonium pectorale]|uniref:Uncharacterized protein n=1 Tax=Gonium pectorale TaxID=33097 RepID=A0A150G5I7_GONPE|nr:hypothetical protein GPECTOR_58g540 [Gonium pectorale]|eukprot:KXZ45091.1 hypothetical protein GPECTOR_58g540 [Gonium pectorale]